MKANIDTEGRGHVPRLDELGKRPSQQPNAPKKAGSPAWLGMCFQAMASWANVLTNRTMS